MNGDLTLDDVQRWCAATYGHSTTAAQITKLDEEMEELDASSYRDVREMADVVIVLCNLAERSGASLWQAIQEKHAINVQRTWAMDERGVISHVEEDA
jgi:hypothetical protein